MLQKTLHNILKLNTRLNTYISINCDVMKSSSLVFYFHIKQQSFP